MTQPEKLILNLHANLQTGKFKSLTAQWIDCSSVTEPVSEVLERRATKRATITPLACPLVWAQEANAFDCVSDVN